MGSLFVLFAGVGVCAEEAFGQALALERFLESAVSEGFEVVLVVSDVYLQIVRVGVRRLWLGLAPDVLGSFWELPDLGQDHVFFLALYLPFLVVEWVFLDLDCKSSSMVFGRFPIMFQEFSSYLCL